MLTRIDVAELAGIVAEGILYGIFVALAAATFYILLFQRRYSRLNMPMTVATCVMFCLATSQLIVDTINIFRAFIPLDQQERIMFLTDATQPIFAAKHAIYFTMMITGDTIVIYRCWVIWNKSPWIILLPVLCSLGSAVCAYQTIWAARHITSVTIAAETDWGLAVLTLSLAANGIATGLLVYRVWSTTHQIGQFKASHSNSSILPIIKVVLETGLVNAAYLLVYTVVYKAGSVALEIMASISTPLIGIIFTTVIIRAGIASEHKAYSTRNGSVPVMRVNTSARSGTAVEVRTHVGVDTWSDQPLEMSGMKKSYGGDSSNV